MGVTSSQEPNALSEAPETHFDSSRHSHGLEFGDRYQTVTFPPDVRDKVAYLNHKLHKECHVNKRLKMRLQVECGDDSDVLVGFSNESGVDTCRSPRLATSENYYLFNISRGTVSLQSKPVEVPHIPLCGNQGEVMWELDITTNTIQYTVQNKYGSIPTALLMQIGTDIPDEVWPLVGVLNSGRQNVSLSFLQPLQSTVTEPAGFEEETAFGELEFKSEGKIMSRPNVTGNSFAVVNRRLDTGIHRWTLRVDCDIGASLCLGLVKLPFSISDSYSDHLKHIYRHKQFMSWRSYRGFLYANGNQLPKVLEPLGWLQNRCVIVEFVLNLFEGTLEIFKDGAPLGIAFENVKGPVKPAVAFYAAYEKSVELVDFTSDTPPPSEPLILIPGSSPVASKFVTCFDASSKYGSLDTSNNGTSVSRDRSQSGNAYCLLDVKCTEGVYRWSFILECDQGASTCIGVTTEPIDNNTQTNIYDSKSMFLYRSFQGILYRQGNELTKHLVEFWMEGSLIEVILDLENRVLQYTVNGEDQGVAFANLNAPCYRPIVAFYASMEKKITLVHFEHQPPKQLQAVSSFLQLNRLGNDDQVSKVQNEFQISSSYHENRNQCIVCGVRDRNVIALPCQHTILCVDHIRSDGSQRCEQCNSIITGVWNVF